eukprot:3977454-Alexandrium_andersonii.AAC.1
MESFGLLQVCPIVLERTPTPSIHRVAPSSHSIARPLTVSCSCPLVIYLASTRRFQVTSGIVSIAGAILAPVAGSSSEVAFGTMPGRRISGAKVASLCSSVSAQERAQQAKDLQDELTDNIRHADLDALLFMKAMLQRGAEEARPKKFPRGRVTQITEGALKAVPDYFEELRKVFLWGIGADEATPVPNRELLLSEFVDRYAEQHLDQGNRLANKLATAEDGVDWDRELGAYALQQSDPKSE